MMSRRKSWPATACMPSRQLAGCPPRPRSIGWSPSSWLACSPHHRWAHLGDGGSPAGVVAVVGHVRPDLADGPVDLHVAHDLHQRPSQASVPSRPPTACNIEGSAQWRRVPVGVRRPSEISIPWLAFLLSRWLGGRVPHPVQNSSSGRLSRSQGAYRAWSGPSAGHGSSAGCLGCRTTRRVSMDHTQSDPLATESFPTDPSGLPEAGRPELLELADGDTLELRVGPVAKRLGDTRVRMLGYNGSVPGPTLKVQQGSEIVVRVTNNGDLDTTVHWHGLRLENKYDGVPHETQAPIPVGGEFSYRIQFPDAGLYWYHPHIREDYTQELGLYGNILVVPTE